MSTPSPAELIIIVIVLLIVVGPEQLPGVVRKAGKFVSQARSMTDGLRGEFMAGLDEIERSTDPRRWQADSADPLPVTHSASPELRAKNEPSDSDSADTDTDSPEADSSEADSPEADSSAADSSRAEVQDSAIDEASDLANGDSTNGTGQDTADATDLVERESGS